MGAKVPNPYGLYDMTQCGRVVSRDDSRSEACEESSVSAKNSEFGDYAEAETFMQFAGEAGTKVPIMSFDCPLFQG
jgi:hypothetical protein